MLLCLAVKEEKKTLKFRKLYFCDNTMKIDYKVRESSHDFLNMFVDFLLNGNSLNTLKEQYWYSGEYEFDITIRSVIQNYQCIEEFLNENNDITYDYVENNIEFWYFDTELSMQGEELYLYMNSRGETVTQSESVKARLIRKLESEKDKSFWGREWESWQDFFWKNKGKNKNSDTGMEEFLRWITIIEKIKASDRATVEKITNDISKLGSENEINMEYLDFNTINKYFGAIKKIKQLDLINNKRLKFKDDDEENIFTKKQLAIGYFRLLPVIIYLVGNEKPDLKFTLRYGRFFSNLSKNSNISRDPYAYTVNTVRMTFEFLERDYYDVIDLINFVGKYDSLLIKEETEKLRIYKVNHDIREDIEELFWNAEDYYFCDGSLNFLFRCMKYDITKNTFSKDTLKLFNSVFSCFSELMDDYNDDLLRRALLTKGDYKVIKTYSYSYEGFKYSFLGSGDEWKKEFVS